jgi:cytochrome c556
MKSMRRSDWSLLSAAVVGALMLGGCSPQPEPGPKEKPQEPKTAAAAPQEAAAKPEAKPPAKPPAGPEESPKPETKAEKPAKAEPPAAADLPPPPKVSSFAPAEDLVYQMDKYLDEMEQGTANEAEYKDLPEGKVSQTGSTMVLLAVALGSSDQDNKYKANAAALLAACQKLAAATDYAATKQAVEGVAAAAKSQGPGGGEVKWAKLADLKDLMKQVPNINTKLKTNVKRLSARAKEAGGNSAALAVIAQGSMANVSDTIKPAESKKWFANCAEMREAAAAVNAGVHARNEKAVNESMDRLQKSCEDCHDVFKEKKDEEKKPAPGA